MAISIKNPETKRVLEVYEALKKEGVVKNISDFCHKLPYAQSTMSKIEKGERPAPISLLHLILKRFNANPDYLFDGKTPTFLNGEKPALKAEVSNAKEFDLRGPRKNLTIVPLKAFGGLLNGYANKVYMETLEKMPFPWIHGECFAFEVEGFSMYLSKVIDGELFERGYKPQSFVVCTPVEKLGHLVKDKDYVFQTIDGIILKTFVRMDDKLCHLKAINNEYNPTKAIPLKNIKNVYFVERKL